MKFPRNAKIIRSHFDAAPFAAVFFLLVIFLMLGALIPFLLLLVYGLDRTLNKSGSTVKFSALGAMMLFMLIAEITIDWPIFPNPYNWFHM